MQPDVIIVGGGTSGCVLAARLTENGQRRVLLIEAGVSDEDYPQTVVQSRQAAKNVIGRGKHKVRWMERMRGNLMPSIMLRGNVLGGTSAINYMAAVRGMPEDFDGWAELGCEGWSWNEVLPYFRKAETDTDFGSTELHGDKGPMRLRRWRSEKFTGIHRAFYDGIREVGIPASPDINNRSTLPGVCSFPGTVSDDGDTRLSVSQAYLTPDVRQRKNLEIRTNSRVARVIIEAGKTKGVELISGEKLFANEVILCCGAFESPKMLLLSGVGPQDELSRHQIAVKKHLPGVGQGLQDHVAMGLIYRAPYREPDLGSPAKTIWIGASEGDNLDFHVLPSPVLNVPFIGEVCNVMVFNLHPTTTGSVRLKSRNPLDNPDIDLNFLTDEADLNSVLKPMHSISEWENSTAFKAWGGRRITPRKLPATIEDVRKAKRLLSISYFHQVGTCAMGSDTSENAVVDTQCRVRGIDGLRVVDASVMPRIIRGNTYLCCVMVAEKIADNFD